MDGISMLVGLLVGAVIGALAMWAFAASRTRAGVASEAQARALLDAATKERERALAETRDERKARAAADQASAALEASLVERERAVVELRRQFDESRKQLADTFKATGAEVMRTNAEEFSKKADEQMSATLKPLKEQLAKNEQLVRELGEKREGDANKLSEQLRTIADLQTKTSAAATTLTSALKDTRQRGKWGEVGLGILLESSQLERGIHFIEQASIEGEAGRLRPDVIVKLPGQRVIAIDSKFPLNAYLESLALEIDDIRRAQLRRDHAAALKGHVQALAKKDYAGAIEGSLEFTVLYMPVESAVIAALETDPDLHQSAFDSRVLIVTPSTLFLMLRTVASNWSDQKLFEGATAIRDAAREMVTRVSTLAGHMNGTGSRLAAAVDSYNKMVASFDGRLVKQINEVASVTMQEPVKLDGELDSTVRTSRNAQLPAATDPPAPPSPSPPLSLYEPRTPSPEE